MTDTDTSREVVEKIGSDLAQFGCLGEQARDTLRALLARAEIAEAAARESALSELSALGQAEEAYEGQKKAEAERDTAWNDAIEAAADAFRRSWDGEVEDEQFYLEGVRALRKGDSHE